MVEGRTESGFDFKLDDDVLDDYELLEALRKIDKGDGQYSIDLVERLLGEEQKERLKEHVRGENGRISMKNVMREVKDIFKSCTAGKN